MEELAEYNGLPHITYHGLRHSYVCYLSSKLGLTVYEVADRIGDTVAVVLEHYYQFFNQSKIYSVLHIICFAVWDFDSFAIDVIDIDLFVCIRSVFNIYYTNN